MICIAAILEREYDGWSMLDVEMEYVGCIESQQGGMGPCRDGCGDPGVSTREHMHEKFSEMMFLACLGCSDGSFSSPHQIRCQKIGFRVEK